MNMKRTLLALLATTIGMSISHAQSPVKRYEATYTTGAAYTPITNGTDLGFDADWDDTVSNAITLPFTFKYQNKTVHTVTIETYGSLLLDGLYHEKMGSTGHIMGINMDYIAAGRGKVYYGTTGTTGNRIFKVEYRNVSHWSDATGTDTFNFQIWLYESDHAIEYRAGYSNVPDSMFANNTNELMDEKELVLCGLCSNPGDTIATADPQSFVHLVRLAGGFSDMAILLTDLESNANTFDEILFGAFPPNGSVIRFSPVNPNSIAKVDFDMATVYPNPSRDGKYSLILKEAPKADAILNIYDLAGKVVLSLPLSQASVTIDLTAYANGNYFGKIVNGDRTGSFRLVKE